MNFYTFRQKSEENLVGEKKPTTIHRPTEQVSEMESIDETGTIVFVLLRIGNRCKVAEINMCFYFD